MVTGKNKMLIYIVLLTNEYNCCFLLHVGWEPQKRVLDRPMLQRYYFLNSLTRIIVVFPCWFFFSLVQVQS